MRGDVLHRARCVSGGTVLQLSLDGLATSGVYALVGLGVQVAYAGSRVLHLGLGDAAIFGAIVGAALAAGGVPAWVAAVVALLVAGVLSAAMERVLVRPSRGRVALAAAALVAGGTVLRQVLAGVFTHAAYAFPALSATWAVGGGVLRASDALTAAVAVGGAVLFGVVVLRTRVGAALRVTAGGEAAAESIGVDTRRVRLLAFGVAGVVAGLACVLAAGRVAATPAAGVAIGLKGLCAAAAGGFGSPLAVCLGAALIGGTEVGATFVLGGGGEAVTYVVAAAALAAGWRWRR
ncbi:MAG TPA: branched-chain amino acid ABC transporter permease [Candidatus Angelobacter sp.]|jgi:branched-chain amino acid transport system permease protein|nr:branched-chain amino acid ABC transporter permease [Candidatus Angelobacter sp.]